MTANFKIAGVIESGALEAAVVEQKAAGLDQIDPDPEAGGQPEQRTGILRDVRLEQGEAQSTTPRRYSRAGSQALPDTVYRRRSILDLVPIYAAVCHIVRSPQPYSLPRRADGCADYEV